MKKTLTLIVAASAVFATPAIRAEDHSGHAHAKEAPKKVEAGHDGHDHAAGAHDDVVKTTLTIKGVATIELAHDAPDGKVVLTVLGADKKALKPTKAPRLNLVVAGKKKQVKTKAVATVKAGNAFAAENAALKGKLTGQVTIKIGDKTHKVEINPVLCAEGHDHSAH
jgi:hypothetical protein